MAVKHPSISVSCLLCMWGDWKKLESYENGTEWLVQLFPFFAAYELSFWFSAVMLSPCQQEGARAMVATCPLIATTEKRQLGCTEAHRYRCTAWRGFKKNLIPFCFFLALAHLLWCWDLVLESQAFLIPLFQMPEGGVVQSLKTWGVIQEWAEVEETHIPVTQFCMEDFISPSLLLVPVVRLSRSMLFLFQREESQWSVNVTIYSTGQ